MANLSSLIPENRGDIKTFPCSDGENSKHGRAVVPSQRGVGVAGEGSRERWKLRQTDLFSTS